MSEYFFVKEVGSSPLYEVPDDYKEGAYSTRFTFPSKPIPVLAKYKPKESYQINDILLYPEFSISCDIFDSIDVKNMYGINWIPTVVKDGGEYRYMMIQIANKNDVVDHDLSVYRRKNHGRISGMTKLVLNEDKIMSIPLIKRLIFRDKSWGFHVFFHKTIVDLIKSSGPTGVEFVPISNFNDSWVG